MITLSMDIRTSDNAYGEYNQIKKKMALKESEREGGGEGFLEKNKTNLSWHSYCRYT